MLGNINVTYVSFFFFVVFLMLLFREAERARCQEMPPTNAGRA